MHIYIYINNLNYTYIYILIKLYIDGIFKPTFPLHAPYIKATETLLCSRRPSLWHFARHDVANMPINVGIAEV